MAALSTPVGAPAVLPMPPAAGIATINTPFHGYAVQFSPFDGSALAVATAQHFGIVGNGRWHALAVERSLGPPGAPGMSPLASEPVGIQEVRSGESKQGLYDVAWSESRAGMLATAGADGAIRLWDVESPVCAFSSPCPLSSLLFFFLVFLLRFFPVILTPLFCGGPFSPLAVGS
jgi:hypothetical protein